MRIVFTVNALIIIVGFVLHHIFNNDPVIVEEFYFNRIFIPFRSLSSTVFKFIPFSGFYIWLFLLIFLIFLIRKYSLSSTHENWVFGLQLLGIVLAHVSFFYIIWGFNYQRLSISDRLQLNEAVSNDEFVQELELTLEQLNRCRSQINENQIINWSQLNEDLCNGVSEFLRDNNLTYFCPVYSKPLYPKGSLLIWSTVGIYWPFATESMIDAGLHHIEIPFTMAHELAHGMGWTDEGECNWIAYESCIRNENINIKYSAYLSYWKYLIYQLTVADSSLLRDLYSRLDTVVINDLRSIRYQHDQYPNFFPKIRNAFYNWYLRKNRVQAGILSYDEIIRLVSNYRKKTRLAKFN